MSTFRKIILILSLILGFHSGPHIQAMQVGKPFFRNYTAQEYKGHNRNFSIECDSTGRVFVANFEGLMIYDGTDWSMIHTPGISRITALYKDKKGCIWIGGNNVFGYVFEGDSLNVKLMASDVDSNNRFGEISEIFEQNGSMFFHTNENKYFAVHNGKIIESKSKGEKQRAEDVWNGSLVNERIDILDQKMTALATTDKGVVLLDEEGKYVYSLDVEDKLCSNNVKALAYDGKGSLWGATDNGLFSISVSPIYSHYGDNDGLVGQVTSILQNGNHLYVGTLQGLFELNEKNRFVKISGNDLVCWQLVKTQDNATLAATAEGIYLYGKEKRQLTTHHTLCVLPDETSLLAGELDGIYRYDNSGQGKMIAKVPNVVKFKQDEQGGIWAITLYRETYYRAPKSDTFVKKNNDEITLLFEFVDGEGHVWHSNTNNQGLFCDALSKNQTKWCTPLVNYSIQAMELSDGIAWVGGNFGLIRLDMEHAKTVEVYFPQLYFRKFQHDGTNVGFSASVDKQDPIGETQYSYRVHEKGQWSKWATDNKIALNHLASGRYQFAVRAMDAFGTVTQSESISVKIPAPFYLRWYIILLYILFVGCIVYAYFQWRLYRAKQEQQRLESIVNERTKELKDAQNQLLRQEREATVGKLTKGLIDRILNPMNYINNFSHLSLGLTKDLKQNIEDEEDKMSEDTFEDSMDVLDMMKTNLEKIEQHGISTTRILKAMEELLQDRSGKTESVNVCSLVQQSADMFRKYYADDIDKYGILVECKIPDTPVMIELNANNIIKVLASMLSNSLYAVKKKAAKGADGYVPAISLTLIANNGGNEAPHVVAYDNGIGIEESIQDKLFDPFFTTKPTGEAPGVGLYLAQQIVQDYGGSISFKSTKDEFTQFTITLPHLEQ